MGFTKTNHYTEQQNSLAKMFKAIGHPGRLAILEHILKVEDCISNDIVNELPLAQATVSQHLKELKNAGLIQGTIEGNKICYCVNPDTIMVVKQYINTIVGKLSKNNQCC